MAKKYREVRRILRDAGWVQVRTAGSHETWVNAAGTRWLTVAGKDPDTVPRGTLAAMRRTTGIEELR